MATLLNKNAERRVQYKIDANKTEIMFPNLECLSVALLRDLLPSGSTPAGDSAYITDASDLVPVESLKVNIQPVQSGTGDPSPENVRTITGWNDVTVTVTNNKESTDPEYVEQNYIVPLGRTVYGGTLDVTTGELVVNVQYVTLDGTESWGYQDEMFYTGTKHAPTSYPDMVCSAYKVVKSYAAMQSGDFVISSTSTVVRIKDSRYTKVDELTTYLAQNPVQLVYPLVAPQTYTLTPQQVTLLKGINNIFADAGTVEVMYSADIQLYIDGKIAETQALVLEN